MSGVDLHDPWLLLLALLVPAALLWRRLRGAPSVTFAPGPEGLPRTWRTLLLPIPRLLQIAGLLLIVVALARPVERTRLALTTEGIDILLCLDTSSSMTANDMDSRRTRLEVAKDAAARFISGRPDDRIGLVVFARYPDLRCPPTLDHDALGQVLADVTTVDADGPEDATGIGAAVARAADVLNGSESGSKVVILLTDGEENVATRQHPNEIAPVHAAQLCERLGVRVYTVAAGVGEAGAVGRAPVDTGPVERLSARTGGRFFAARDAEAVRSVYAAIDTLERVELDEPRFRTEERFVPVLSAALLLLLASRLLASTVFLVLP
jgi:Ca-activated chloride channel homolog